MTEPAKSERNVCLACDIGSQKIQHLQPILWHPKNSGEVATWCFQIGASVEDRYTNEKIEQK